MHPRKKVRPATDGSNAITVDLGAEIGPTVLRLPGLATSARLAGLFKSSSGEEAGGAASPLADLIEIGGLAIGLCWEHRSIDLGTEMPARLKRMSEIEIEDYSEAVIAELTSAGASSGALLKAAGAIVGHVTSLLASVSADREEAEDLADFTPPMQVEGPSSAPTSA